MATGIDLNTSRRTLHNKCRYWKVKTKNKDKSEIVYEQKPDGMFYAKEISAFSKDNQIVGDVFMFNSKTITIMTTDKVDINTNDVVEFNGNLWIVVNIQKRRKLKQAQFLKHTSEETYMQLKG